MSSTIAYTRALCDILVIIPYSSITSSYTLLAGPYSGPTRLWEFDNMTNGSLLISFDGVNNHKFLAPTSGKIYDICSNRSPNAMLETVYQQIYVKYTGTTPSSGDLYIARTYAG